MRLLQMKCLLSPDSEANSTVLSVEMIILCFVWTEPSQRCQAWNPCVYSAFCCVNRVASFSQKGSPLIKGGCVLCKGVYTRARYPTGVLHSAPRAMQHEEDPSEASAQEPSHKLHEDTCAQAALSFFLCPCMLVYDAPSQSTLVCNNVCVRVCECDLKSLMACLLTNCFCFLQTTKLKKKTKETEKALQWLLNRQSRGTFTRAYWEPFREAVLSMLLQHRWRFLFEAHSVTVRLEPWGPVHAYTEAHSMEDTLAAGVCTFLHRDLCSSGLNGVYVYVRANYGIYI